MKILISLAALVVTCASAHADDRLMYDAREIAANYVHVRDEDDVTLRTQIEYSPRSTDPQTEIAATPANVIPFSEFRAKRRLTGRTSEPVLYFGSARGTSDNLHSYFGNISNSLESSGEYTQLGWFPMQRFKDNQFEGGFLAKTSASPLLMTQLRAAPVRDLSLLILLKTDAGIWRFLYGFDHVPETTLLGGAGRLDRQFNLAAPFWQETLNHLKRYAFEPGQELAAILVVRTQPDPDLQQTEGWPVFVEANTYPDSYLKSLFEPHHLAKATGVRPFFDILNYQKRPSAEIIPWRGCEEDLENKKQ